MRTKAWMKRMCLLLVAVLTVSNNLIHAQNAPVTSIASTGGGIPGQQVVVPVLVSGFINIGSFTLTLHYNYSDLQYVSGAQNPMLSGNAAIGDHDLGNGMHRIVMSWFGNAEYIPDGEFLINLTFAFNNGPSTLEWYDNGPSCVYTDDNANQLNDFPSASFYVNGMVCNAIANPGDISGLNALCQGQTNIGYSISPISNVSGYGWSVPEGAIITSGGGTNTILVDYGQNAVSGNVSVNGLNECGDGPVSVLAVTVYPQPLAAAGNDTTILYGTTAQLHASNAGTGTFSYHWLPEALLVDPNVQHPVTVPLTSSALFELEVTEMSGFCVSTDEVSVTISGGPLSVVPLVVPGMICRGENAQLFANAGGGSGDYSYNWTSDPPGNPVWSSMLPNPVVSPVESTQYLLVVSDGFNTSGGSTSLTVHALPTALISGGDTICDDGSMAAIQLDLTGTPPWSVTVSNTVNIYTFNDILNSPYWVYLDETGQYTVNSVQDIHCFGTSTGLAEVLVNPLPPTPVISQSDIYILSSAESGNQWYLNGQIIPGATGQSYIPVTNGLYSCIVTENGCQSDTSNTLNILITSSNSLVVESLISLFPNPADDQVTLKSGNLRERILHLSLYTSTGIRLFTREYAANDTGFEIVINIEDLASGVYLLRIFNGNASFQQKLIVLHNQ